MICRFGKLIKSITSYDITLNVYTNVAPEKNILEEFSNLSINYKGSIGSDQLYLEMKKSNFLLHIESDDSDSISKTKLSVSTKIPEYLSTSIPIISFGPIEVASMRILSDNLIGFVLNSCDPIFFNQEKLISFFNNIKLQKQYSENGHIFCSKYFNKKIQDNLFFLQITKALNLI